MNRVARLAADPSVAALRGKLITAVNRVIEEAMAIQQIPAPTFDEGQRAAYVANRFKALDSVEIDGLHNVYGRLPGLDCQRPALLIAAHTDTVFDRATPLDVRRDNGRIYGPGLGDNSLGVAALLAMVDVLRDQRLPVDVWFVANTREEGLGDLGGIRAAYEKLKARLGAAIIIEGIAFGRVYHAGIAVRRLKISCRAPGGHSWLHFGRPSAIHGLMRLGAQITTLIPPETPRTTYNIGVIEGGTTVNSLATDAWLLLDLRSEDRGALAAMEQQVMGMIDSCRASEQDFTVEVVGDRPAGSIPVNHPLVELARDSLEAVGVRPVFEIGSTDANALLAAGLPTVTIGITQGGNAHRPDEYIDTANIPAGLLQLLLLTVAAADLQR
ncbi:MAG: M20/M25/M40 family metallo-hydrolase [Anaerolineae bacterium]|nr:M20/M25/M40 family metallo-hydrolase [Anaerolineae bacterium]